MTFFKRIFAALLNLGKWVCNSDTDVTEDSNKLVNVEEVYVLTATINSNYVDGLERGPQCVTWYFLAKIENGEYYELFSGLKLEKERDCHGDWYCISNYNIPYVTKEEPLRKYLRDDCKIKMVNLQSLFDFITIKNVESSLSQFNN